MCLLVQIKLFARRTVCHLHYSEIVLLYNVTVLYVGSDHLSWLHFFTLPH